MSQTIIDPQCQIRSLRRVFASGTSALIAFRLAPPRGQWPIPLHGQYPSDYTVDQLPVSIVVTDLRPGHPCMIVHNLEPKGGSCELRPGTPFEAAEHQATERCIVLEFGDTHTELVMADAAVHFSVDDAVRLERLMGQALNCVPV